MRSSSRELLSVGIDVGTTTTQVVFSRLLVRDTARGGSVPRLAIDTRTVVYESPVHLTPLASADDVDADRLAAIVAGEYAAAGVEPEAVETGAVVVTGEIARTRNADAILDAISALAGDFVVTVAGPNLEAQIAARGSGAAAYSTEHYSQVTNIDIGGGTANAAIFRLGRHLDSSAAAVGGRQVELSATSGAVVHVAPPGRRLADLLGLELREGAPARMPELERLCEAMAEVVADLALGEEGELTRAVALGSPMPAAAHSTAVLLSGGVGSCYYREEDATTLDAVAAYGDVGPLLGHALRLDRRLSALEVVEPDETVRATVLGAASQTVTLSGSTIWAEPSLLPLRNLPVVRPHLNGALARGGAVLAGAISDGLARWDREGDGQVALALDLPERLDYDALHRLASGVTQYAEDALDADEPVVIVTGRDYAQALGQTVQGLTPSRPLVVIDQVGLDEGDFIDIGTPILDGRAVPLSVKTLVFYR